MAEPLVEGRQFGLCGAPGGGLGVRAGLGGSAGPPPALSVPPSPPPIPNTHSPLRSEEPVLRSEEPGLSSESGRRIQDRHVAST